jgi:hypothetical protein
MHKSVEIANESLRDENSIFYRCFLAYLKYKRNLINRQNLLAGGAAPVGLRPQNNGYESEQPRMNPGDNDSRINSNGSHTNLSISEERKSIKRGSSDDYDAEKKHLLAEDLDKEDDNHDQIIRVRYTENEDDTLNNERNTFGMRSTNITTSNNKI